MQAADLSSSASSSPAYCTTRAARGHSRRPRSNRRALRKLDARSAAARGLRGLSRQQRARTSLRSRRRSVVPHRCHAPVCDHDERHRGVADAGRSEARRARAGCRVGVRASRVVRARYLSRARIHRRRFGLERRVGAGRRRHARPGRRRRRRRYGQQQRASVVCDDRDLRFRRGEPKLLSAVDCSTTDAAGALQRRQSRSRSRQRPRRAHREHGGRQRRSMRSANPPPTIPPPHTFMSGVAPCAHVRTYKVCTPDRGLHRRRDRRRHRERDRRSRRRHELLDRPELRQACPAIRRGATATRSGSMRSAPTSSSLPSAGNTRPGCNDPGGRVSNIGPWVATIAASTHDENVSGVGALSATGPGSPPAARAASCCCRARVSRSASR